MYWRALEAGERRGFRSASAPRERGRDGGGGVRDGLPRMRKRKHRRWRTRTGAQSNHLLRRLCALPRPSLRLHSHQKIGGAPGLPMSNTHHTRVIQFLLMSRVWTAPPPSMTAALTHSLLVPLLPHIVSDRANYRGWSGLRTTVQLDAIFKACEANANRLLECSCRVTVASETCAGLVSTTVWRLCVREEGDFNLRVKSIICRGAWRQRVLRCRSSLVYRREPWSRGAALAGQHPAVRQQLADMRAGTPYMRPGGFPTDLPDFRAYGTGCLVGGTMVATLEPRNEASGDVFELGVAESTVIEDYNGLVLVVWAVRDCHDDGRITLTRGGGSTAQGRLRPDRQLEAVEVDMSFHQGLLAPFSPELGELTLMYSRSSDGEKPTPRIVQVIDYGESASQPLLHADDCVSVWNPLDHNGHGSEYRVSAWRLAPFRLPSRTRVIALVPANGPDGGGPLMAVVAMLATWCDAQLHLPESHTGAFRIQVRPVFNGQPSAHVVSVKWTHVRLIDMAVTTYCSLPPMETSRPAYAVNPRDLRSWAQPLVYFCTYDSVHSYPQAVRPLRSCSSKLAFSKRSSNASKLACGDGGSADLCSDGTDLVSGSPTSRHGVRVATVRDSSSTSSAVTHAGARDRKGVSTAFDGTSVSTDPRTASCSPSSSSCHSTARLSGDGSAFAPHDSAGTDNGESTVLNGGDSIAEQCSTSCNNIGDREASVLSSDGSACVRHESAGTGDGDPTVLNGSDGVAEQCSTSCNKIREASVLGSDGSACVRHESAGTGDGVPTVLNCVRHESAGTGDGDSTLLNGGDGVAEQCSTSCNNIYEASVLSSDGSACARHKSNRRQWRRPGVDCDGIGGGIAGVSISMASPVATTASDANSSRPDEEDSPAVLNSSSETHAAPTALSRCTVDPTCLSNNGDAGIQHAAEGSGHVMATDDHGSETALTAATEPSAADAPPSTSVAKAPSARSSGARYCSRQCSHCGMLGHLVDRCWKLHPQLRRKTSPVEAASTAPASGEQSSAAQTPTKRRGGDNAHRRAGARLRATAGSKSSAGASNHTASKEERDLRKQVARLKQDAAVLCEHLAGLESRGKESAVPAAHAASCCSGQQSTA
ncbi:hypothetical protein JKP88DRAFT_255357 [Tribonema minus]|uniref:Uncharacterized protein n=1 Tax=Tribonema minus TaxID=303371 RepID=A0A835Z3Y9_9STRA|nr:hypothetical protein JKP88DRAFT_255357 [Tribonema minus]